MIARAQALIAQWRAPREESLSVQVLNELGVSHQSGEEILTALRFDRVMSVIVEGNTQYRVYATDKAGNKFTLVVRKLELFPHVADFDSGPRRWYLASNGYDGAEDGWTGNGIIVVRTAQKIVPDTDTEVINASLFGERNLAWGVASHINLYQEHFLNILRALGRVR